MSNKNFLFGFGERLTEKIKPPKTKPDKAHPYSIRDAVEYLAEPLSEAISQIENLNAEICPDNRAVLPVTLHPSYLAKSYFPKQLMQTFGLTLVGSKPTRVSPRKIVQKVRKEGYASTILYVSGERPKLSQFSAAITDLSEVKEFTGIEEDVDWKWLDDFRKLEEVSYFSKGEKIKDADFGHSNENLYEAVLYISGIQDSNTIIDSFQAYANKIGVKVEVDRRIITKGLCFIPIQLDRSKLEALEKFSFLRLVRRMPSLTRKAPRKVRKLRGKAIPCELPDVDAIDSSIRVAIFDGGIPDLSELHRWVTHEDLTDCKGVHDPDDIRHGEAVTSAFLLGPIQHGVPIEAPYAAVDHYKIYDWNNDTDEDLYHVLERVTDVLSKKKYDFINISVSPEIPVEDDDVHVWTATLDECLNDGQTLATVAAGNFGMLDRDSGNARVQVPGDCVNALTVGAINSTSSAIWARADYSSIGPGRSPGLVKPDIVTFGGCDLEPFHFVENSSHPNTDTDVGTSLAAPLALRMAAGVKSKLGTKVNPLTCKALLIHHADNGNHHVRDVGWGKIPLDVNSLLTSDDSTAKVIYQGLLEPSKFIRAKIPMISALPGFVTIKATVCFASETFSTEPSNYTNSGLQIVFRPDTTNFAPNAQNPKSESFFGSDILYANEAELRGDSKKWETVLHDSCRKLGRTLNEPVFDIHYVARDGSAEASAAKKIPYSLVITVTAPKVRDFYNQIAQKYRTQLEIFTPVTIQVRT